MRRGRDVVKRPKLLHHIPSFVRAWCRLEGLIVSIVAGSTVAG